MAEVAQGASRTPAMQQDRTGNPIGLLLCLMVAAPIWAGIFTLLF